MRSLRKEFPLAFFIAILVFVILMSVVVISLHTLLVNNNTDVSMENRQENLFSTLPKIRHEKMGQDSPGEFAQIDFGESILQAEEAIKEKDYKKAESILRTLLLFFPQSPTVHKMLGNTYYLSGQYMMAEVIYRQFLEKVPTDTVCLNNLAMVMGRQKKFDAAIATMKKVMELVPGSATVELNLAGLYAQQGNKKKAKYYWELAKEKLGEQIYTLQLEPCLQELMEAESSPVPSGVKDKTK